MTRFGPAGASDSFRREGYKHSHQAPAWLAQRGLTAFEYSAGHGVRIGEESAAQIGAEAAKYDIAVSIHAPYYINLANEFPDKQQAALGYLRDSAKAVRQMGGRRVIFHPGSPKKGDRGEAMLRACRLLEQALSMDEMQGIVLCPETAGRFSQLGSIDEIIQLCRVGDALLPTIDFAHLHAQRRIEGIDDYRAVLDRFLDALGHRRFCRFHAHFSHIEYTDKGEKRHRNFDEEGFGPDFAPLAALLHEYKLEPVIICESSGHQAEDAYQMKSIYQEACP